MRPDIIQKCCDELKNTLSHLKIYTEDKACFLYNADESGFRRDPTHLRVIGQKGVPLVRVSGGSGRESTTVLTCVRS